MWGNSLGWTISAVLVMLTITFVGFLDYIGRATSPQSAISLDPKNGAQIALPVPPNSVVHSMTSATDAGPVYRRAIDASLKDTYTYGRFARSGRESDVSSVPAIKILLEATNSSTANVFASNPAEIVNLKSEKPSLEALQTMATCARRAGQLIEKAHPDDAIKLYEAVFALGAKLYQERLTYAELNAGLTMMAEGSAAITNLDPNRAQACRIFDQARRDYVQTRLLPLVGAISSVDEPTLEKHAGDVVYFAVHAKDRMWRVEAIFSLARYRYNAGKVGDQRTAMKIILDLCSDPDPVVRTAAIAARDLTEQQYRMLH